MLSPHTYRLAQSPLIDWAVRIMTILSSTALAVMLLATFVGVVMRYVFSAPLLGGNEIVQLTSIPLVMLAMPYAAQQEAHIRVDVLDGYLGAIGRFVGDLLSRIVAGYVLYLLANRSIKSAIDAFDFGDTTNMLVLPLWPAYALISLGTALYLVVLLLQIIDILRTGPTRDE